MIVYIHQHCGWNALLPGVITKGFTQGVTTDMSLQSTFFGGTADNTVGLITADGM